jgi:hypothetical protein
MKKDRLPDVAPSPYDNDYPVDKNVDAHYGPEFHAWLKKLDARIARQVAEKKSRPPPLTRF